MQKQIVLLVMLLAVLNAANAQRDDRITQHTIPHDGVDRRYQLYVPQSYDPAVPSPLVLVLHGGGGQSDSIIVSTQGGFETLADEHGFILVYPDAIDREWNDGRPFGLRDSESDDVGFIRALIEHLASEYTIDRERVYVTGMSNGGHMSYRLACELSDIIAAVAPVAAMLPEQPEVPCSPTQPVGVLILMGDADPIVPYDGGEVRIGMLRRGTVVSAEETVNYWAGVNACAAEPSEIALDDVDPDDGTRVIQRLFADCAAPVTLYTIEGGGHTWPGGRGNLGDRLVGITTHDIDANTVIWDFFAPLTLTEPDESSE